MENPSLPITERKLHSHYLQAVSQASVKVINIWKGKTRIQKELLFPNDKRKQNAYSVDCYLPDYHLMIEIDGDVWHTDIDRETIRDNHIAEIANHTGFDCPIERIPLAIPKNLIYGNLQGRARELVKERYQQWLENYARESFQEIQNKYRLRELFYRDKL